MQRRYNLRRGPRNRIASQGVENTAPNPQVARSRNKTTTSKAHVFNSPTLSDSSLMESPLHSHSSSSSDVPIAKRTRSRQRDDHGTTSKNAKRGKLAAGANTPRQKARCSSAVATLRMHRTGSQRKLLPPTSSNMPLTSKRTTGRGLATHAKRD